MQTIKTAVTLLLALAAAAQTLVANEHWEDVRAAHSPIVLAWPPSRIDTVPKDSKALKIGTLDDVMPSALARLSQLAYLEVDDKLDTKALKSVCALPSLRSLHIWLAADCVLDDAALERLTNLRCLRVLFSAPGHSRLSWVPKLVHLEFLDLSGNELQRTDVESVAKARNLRHLVLDHCRGLESSSLSCLAPLTSLSSLSVAVLPKQLAMLQTPDQGTKLSLDFVKDLRALSTLTLDHRQIDSSSLLLLHELPKFRKLRAWGCEYLSGHALDVVLGIRTLVSLEITLTLLPPIIADYIPDFATAKQLEHLGIQLAWNSSPPSAAFLSSLPQCEVLKSLRIDGHSCSPSEIQWIGACRRLVELFVVVDTQKISPEAFGPISSLTIKQLGLWLNGPYRSELLGQLRTMEALKHLRVFTELLADQALRDIAAIEGVEELILEASGGGVTQVGMRALATMPRLSYLVIAGGGRVQVAGEVEGLARLCAVPKRIELACCTIAVGSFDNFGTSGRITELTLRSCTGDGVREVLGLTGIKLHKLAVIGTKLVSEGDLERLSSKLPQTSIVHDGNN